MPESRRYVLARDWVSGRHTVPNGFQTDGASIPRPLWFLIGSPFAPESIQAAVLHDYLYSSPWRVGVWTRGMVDREFRGMLMELLENPSRPCTRRIDLVMGTPYTTDLLYDDLFQRLAAAHENFHYHTAISRESGPRGTRVYVDGLIDQDMDTFAPLLADSNTLIYVCGLEGMRFGLYKTLANHGFTDGYLNVKAPLADAPPEQWQIADMKPNIKPTARSMLEVY